MSWREWFGFTKPRDAPDTELPKIEDNVRDSGGIFVFGMTNSGELVKAACFYMDLKAIKLCDILLANCNGIEIDSGTAAEIGLAYGLQKKTVL